MKEQLKANKSVSPVKRSARAAPGGVFTDKKRANLSPEKSDVRGVMLEEEQTESQGFDEMLSMGDSCDLRRQGEDSESHEIPSKKKQTSFQKVWSREITQVTKVSKSKDILPVLRDLVSSLE